MFKTDIIKRYIFKPNYYKYEKIYNYEENLKIFNNNCILYLYISIYDYLDYLKIKQIKQNYIISFYFNHNKNKIFFNKIKNYDNTDIIKFNDYYKCIFDLRISNDEITKKNR